MDLKSLTNKTLETLFDPAQPYIYIVVAPSVLLAALGRVRLALLWLALCAVFFGLGAQV